jgi:hypothetical protein
VGDDPLRGRLRAVACGEAAVKEIIERHTLRKWLWYIYISIRYWRHREINKAFWPGIATCGHCGAMWPCAAHWKGYSIIDPDTLTSGD